MESNPTDAMKASAQSLLRHSERKQSDVYDRRGKLALLPPRMYSNGVLTAPAQKKAAAQRFAALSGSAKRLRDYEDEERQEVGQEVEAPRRRAKSPNFAFARDMLVVVPYVDSG